MQKVGTSVHRNQEFSHKFDKSEILKQKIENVDPVIFDIGAYQGQSVELFIEIFSNPVVYSFEPSLKTFKELKRKKYKNNRCYNLAVSNVNGQTVFYENEISHTNSLYKVNKKSNDSISIMKETACGGEKHKAVVNSAIKVNTITLDEFFISNKLSEIDILKIDVQGAESLVLEGAREIFLKNTKAIMVEIALYDYYENSSNISDIESQILPFGFHLYSILDVSHNPMNGRTDWVELFYTKDNNL